MIKERPTEKIVCGCSQEAPATPVAGSQEMARRPWVTGFLSVPSGDIPLVATSLNLGDRLSAVRVRWGLGRMSY
jgi:hypothetical protein